MPRDSAEYEQDQKKGEHEQDGLEQAVQDDPGAEHQVLFDVVVGQSPQQNDKNQNHGAVDDDADARSLLENKITTLSYHITCDPVDFKDSPV